MADNYELALADIVAVLAQIRDELRKTRELLEFESRAARTP